MTDAADIFDAPRAVRRGAWPSLGVALATLLLGVPLIHGIGGAVVSWRLMQEVETAASGYDASYDAIVVRDGNVTAGPRIVHEVGPDGSVFLVDPDETVPDGSITASEALIVRRTEVIRRQPLREQRIALAQVQEALGVHEVIIDSTHVGAWLEAHRLALLCGLTAMFMLVSLADFAVLPLYALVGAFVGSLVHQPDQTVRSVFPLALVVAVPTVAVRWLLYGLGAPSLTCLGPLIWPATIAMATLVLLRGRRG